MTSEGAGADADAAYEQYRQLLDLWSKENPIKTTKLQVLLAVNALLAAILGLADQPLVSAEHVPVFVAGIVVSLVWTFSIGRTARFQAVWANKLHRLAAQFPDDPRFAILPTDEEKHDVSRVLTILGSVPSKWYLLFAPPFFAAVWTVILLWALATE